MAVGAAIFSGVMALSAASAQQAAGAKAQSAAEENARSINVETQENIGQARRSQAQVMGSAKAAIASSGVKFDVSKISKVKFGEGGEGKRSELTGYRGQDTWGDQTIYNEAGEGRTAIYEDKLFEKESGIQTAGAEEGDSAFTYLREMKKNFAKDIGFMGKQGRSRERVTRMGGEVAQAQASAGAASSYANAASSFGAAGKSAGWWK